MENITKNLFEATDILINKKLQSLKYDRTILVKLYRNDSGFYTIEYQGQVFDNVQSINNIEYENGNYVYVLVPEGDINKTKFILGKVG